MLRSHHLSLLSTRYVCAHGEFFYIFFQPPLTRLPYHFQSKLPPILSQAIYFTVHNFSSLSLLIGRRHRSIKHSILCVHISLLFLPACLHTGFSLSHSSLCALWRIAVPSRWKKNELFIIVFAQPVHWIFSFLFFTSLPPPSPHSTVSLFLISNRTLHSAVAAANTHITSSVEINRNLYTLYVHLVFLYMTMAASNFIYTPSDIIVRVSRWKIKRANIDDDTFQF